MSSNSNSKSNWRQFVDFNEVARYADAHNHEMMIAIYALGATGVLIMVRSLRIFTKFTSIHKIPDNFIRKQIKLQGFVRSVEGGEKETLNVEHIPVVELSYHKGVKDLLPVRLAGVGKWHEPAASKFVADQVLNKRITFQLIQEGPKEDFILAGVCYQPYRFLPYRSLNADLVENGLAPYLFDGTQMTVEEKDPQTGNTKLFQLQPVDRKLAERLMHAVRVAQRKQVGIWQGVKPEETTALVNPTLLDRMSTLITAATESATAVTRALRYVASVVVFFPAQVKDKIMQIRRTNSS